MKRIEVKLSLPVVAPLLDVIKGISDSLRQELAAPLTFEEVDADFREEWKAELVTTQGADLATLLALFDTDFFSTGVVGFDEGNGDAVLRACSSVRLRLRSRFLVDLDDDALEGGGVDFDPLPEPARKAFMCYLFLATLQELIIQHLDAEILGS